MPIPTMANEKKQINVSSRDQNQSQGKIHGMTPDSISGGLKKHFSHASRVKRTGKTIGEKLKREPIKFD